MRHTPRSRAADAPLAQRRTARPAAARGLLARALLAAAALAVLGVPPIIGISASARWNAAAVPLEAVPVTRQSAPQSCGPAVIATMAGWLAEPVTEAEVLAAAKLGPEGITLGEFARLATQFDLPGAWYQVDHRDLERLATPFVAHLEDPAGGHFVAVLAWRRGYALVADPASGAAVGSPTSVLPGFSGRVYLLRGEA